MPKVKLMDPPSELYSGFFLQLVSLGSFTVAPNEFLTLLIAIIDHHTPYVPLQKHCLNSQSMS